MFLSVLLCRASSSFVFKTPPVRFHWFWPHFCYPCVFQFLNVTCRPWSPLSNDVEERTVGGERFKFGFRWAGPPSYTKITPSSGSKFVLACARKLSKRAAFIPPTASEEDTCESIDERYYHGHSQVSSHLTVCPLSLPRSTVTSGRPNVVAPFVRTNTEVPCRHGP